MFSRLETTIAGSQHPAYSFAVVDEAQDLSVANPRFLPALAAAWHDGLFLGVTLASTFFSSRFHGNL